MRRVFFLCALLGVSACTPEAPPQAEAAPPAATVVDEAGPIIEVGSAESLVNDLDGVGAETVVLNFWATWCAPCRQEFPEFVRFDGEMEDENVEVRFVSLDNPRDLAAVRTFLGEHDVDEPSYLYTGTGDITRELDLFAPGGIPITMILDGGGIRQYTHFGLMPYDELVRVVAAVRAGEDPTPTS